MWSEFFNFSSSSLSQASASQAEGDWVGSLRAAPKFTTEVLDPSKNDDIAQIVFDWWNTRSTPSSSDIWTQSPLEYYNRNAGKSYL